jgi:hypothetical protein
MTAPATRTACIVSLRRTPGYEAANALALQRNIAGPDRRGGVSPTPRLRHQVGHSFARVVAAGRFDLIAVQHPFDFF